MLCYAIAWGSRACKTDRCCSTHGHDHDHEPDSDPDPNPNPSNRGKRLKERHNCCIGVKSVLRFIGLVFGSRSKEGVSGSVKRRLTVLSSSAPTHQFVFRKGSYVQEGLICSGRAHMARKGVRAGRVFIG